MSHKHEKLKTLLKELFQLDQPDLDFGLYRVMHDKSAEVTQFLDKDLLPQVKAAFGQYKTADKAEIEKELAKVIAGIEAAAMDPAQSPRVNELRARFKSDAVDVAALESEVYDHLYSFFRRYYSEGDFLAKRVYKPGVYAIPYEGEEVTLHWANKDQYYIKTSEYLRDYTFRLRPDPPSTGSGQAYKPMRVHFRLADAAEGEHGNVKAAEGKERMFILAASGTRPNIVEEDGEEGKELVIRFEYRPATLADWPEDARDGKSKPPTQKDLIAFAARRVLTVAAEQDANPPLQAWVAELGKLDPTEKEAERTVFTKHLKKYSDVNKFDYFIHKYLGVFLRRELDFYIKNEVMHLDDVENETVPRVEQYLSKIKVIRRIAGKIIDFLAQIEDFQKKLWLKKKFVVETQYCITLGCIPEAFYPEIAANEAQHAEWVKLNAVDEIKGDLVTQGYSKPLKPEFLKAHPTLVMDTRHFDMGFTERLIEALGDVDEQIDGVLFHSENFQALSLMQARYREQVKCVYIDPPYNTGGDGFPYRDDYQHSSWIAMVEDRLILNRQLLTPNGVIFASIDANERVHLEFTMSAIFGRDNRVEEIIWVTNATKNQSPTYSTNHEYVEVFARDIDSAKQEFRMFREPKLGYGEFQDLITELNPSYPPVHEIKKRIRGLLKENKIRLKDANGDSGDSEEGNEDWKGLHNYTHAEYRDNAGRYVPENLAREEKARIWIWTESDGSMPQVKEDSQKEDFRDTNHPAFRFYRPLHPVTKKPCPHPKTGWRWPYKLYGKQSTSFTELDADERIAWGDTEIKVPRTKKFLHEAETNVAKSVVLDFSDGEKELYNLFGKSRAFSNPKPTTLVARFARQTTWNAEFVLDFFGGSGTTGHATINLNREDGGRRKFILVEMGDHFDTVLLPRIKKVIFTPEWKDGKPKRLATPEEAERSPHIVKVVRLESYEDTLNNLETRRTDKQQLLFDAPEAQGADGLKEQYLLRYILNVETRGSQSLLNVQAFTDPTAYKLKVKRPGSDESRDVNVDLLETFNWLIGLTVRHIAAPQIFSAVCERDSEKRLRLKGRLKQEADGPYWFRTVTGATPDGRKTLIIWRKLTGEPEQDNLVLDEWFRKHAYSTKDADFDLIYVNGGNNLPNVRRDYETWKVQLIEEEFQRLMFETEGA
ncbi:MAG: site-specific DNA-methyltransferase [Syntrophales bacterium]|jgi:adenine-specific DNA-methyltransferase|nr:site-specific DNA-methyltransferase [Syntrophales bacterium]